MATAADSSSDNKKPFVLGLDRLDDMTPTFFIGLGGTGGRVVSELSRRLRAEPTWGRYKDLIQFIAIDTDEGDLATLRKRGLQVSNISVDDKPQLIRAARGQTPGVATDERITSWVHDWYNFRSASAKGAGQIRLESRFSFYMQLRSRGNGNVRSLLKDRLDTALRARNAVSGTRVGVRFFLYGSLAGGTGSGANLATAYLCRRLAAEAGIPDIGVEVYGVFFLPSLFRSLNGGPLVNSINANGYSALKEIEWLMELRYDNSPASQGPGRQEEYVHDVPDGVGRAVSEEDRVRKEPFNWVYLVDQPEGKTIDPKQIYRTVGEIALLQLFSPILRQQNSANDNFQKLQMEPRNGFFAVQYGSVGAAVLEFPRKALVHYFARLATVSQLERLVVGRNTDDVGKRGAARSASEDFHELSNHEQNRILDAEFAEFIEDEVKREGDTKKPGMFTDIAVDSERLNNELGQLLGTWYNDTYNELEINGIDGPSLSEENPSLDSYHRNLSRDFRAASEMVQRKLSALGRELSDGRVFGRLFETATPLTQRYLLTTLYKGGSNTAEKVLAEVEDEREKERALKWCLLPGAEGDYEAYAMLGRGEMDRSLFDPEKDEIRKRVQEANRKLQDASGKFFAGARERAFSDARVSVMNQFNNDIVNNIRDGLMRMFWTGLTAALEQAVVEQLDLFRATAKAALGSVSRLRAQAETSRTSGIPLGPIAESFQSTKGAAPAVEEAFHLGTEVFCDHRSGHRMWDDVYRLRVQKQFTIEPKDLASRINQAIAARKASNPQAKDIKGSEVLVDVLVSMEDEMRQRMTQFITAEATGFDLIGGLELEARIVSARRLGAVHADTVDAIDNETIQLYVTDKLNYVRAMSLPLGRIDRGLVAGADLAPYEPRFCGIPPMKGIGGAVKQASRAELVRAAIDTATAGFQAIEGWSTPDVVTLFQGVLGLPLYAWMDVGADLRRSYLYEVQRQSPTPLHTDRRYEKTGFNGHTGLGLPDLDVVGRTEWEAAKAAEAARKARDGLLPVVLRLFAAGVLRKEADKYVAHLNQDAISVGGNLPEAVDQLCQRLSNAAVRRAFLTAAGKPTATQFDQIEEQLNLMLASAAFTAQGQEQELLERLIAAIPAAKAL